jgi:hypothetical protein
MTDRNDAAGPGEDTGGTSHSLGTSRPGHVTRSSRPGRTSPLSLAFTPEEMAMGTVDQAAKQYFTKDQARKIATELGIDFKALGCDLEQFRLGLGVELDHGPRDPETDVSADDPIVTGKIALAHLTEFPDYYTRLAVLEREAADHLSKKK